MTGFSRLVRSMGWPRLVGSLKLQVSFAEYILFCRALLQKRPEGLSIRIRIGMFFVIGSVTSQGLVDWFEVDLSARPASSFRVICYRVAKTHRMP